MIYLIFLQPINLTGKKYLLTGEIHIRPSLDHDPTELSENIIVDVLDRNDEVIDVSRTRVVSNGNDQTGTAIFEYSIWANLGDELIFAPRDSRYFMSLAIISYLRLEKFILLSSLQTWFLLLFLNLSGMNI